MNTWAVCAVLCLFAGCGPRPATRDATDRKAGDEIPPTIRVEPMRVRAVRDKERLAIEAYDADGLFERAALYLRKGRCDEAVSMYERLVDDFPDSRFAAPALYNIGLCSEQLDQYQAAAAAYLGLIENYPDSRDMTDALFRLGSSYEELEAWANAVEIYGRLIMEREDLEGIERVEALARMGSCLIHVGKRDEARLALEDATRLFRAGSGVSPSASTYYYAMARFKIGEIVQMDMREVVMPTDETSLEPVLERKCQLLLDAQGEYTKSIKIGHPHWAAAAAYRIGSLYRNLWEDLTTAPPPGDLDEEAKKIYLDMLKERIRVLLKKAVVQWERTLKMARRLNMSNEWVERTTKELGEIRDILSIDIESDAEDK
ncbi:MAG: tetratricopeptide repeat protein [Deltaproteobacteria bacterium]|nr:tetratricopeptide repeat protein [Deltaproteobacteria bacterium]